MVGQTYILSQEEELWEKSLPEQVENLLGEDHDVLADRNTRDPKNKKKRVKSDVVKFRVPHNSAIQIYDYKAKKARWVLFNVGVLADCMEGGCGEDDCVEGDCVEGNCGEDDCGKGEYIYHVCATRYLFD